MNKQPAKKPPEKMSDFFAARVDIYDEHMLAAVKGCKEGYQKFAELVPINTTKILDLGCGTGLELDEIFMRMPNVSVIGIDLTQAMLDKLKQKHHDKDIKLICGNYFDIDLGEGAFETAISFQAMHHFPRDEKVGLYTRIHKALRANGVYIECDYMVTEQSLEDERHIKNAEFRREMNVPQGEIYHFDMPCTVDNQIAMLMRAGFSSAELVYRVENTTIIIAKK
jgi:SAM-dependent methyltransferase